jgi:hypothetical protein
MDLLLLQDEQLSTQAPQPLDNLEQNRLNLLALNYYHAIVSCTCQQSSNPSSP